MSKIKSEDYKVFLQFGDKFKPVPSLTSHEKIPSGVYKVDYNKMLNEVTFITQPLTHDKIVDLPNSPYSQVLADMQMFLSDDCRARFKEVSLLPKNNVLLWGVPGGGKTVIASRLAEEVINKGGVVIFNPDPKSIEEIFRVFECIQPETTLMILVEELDQQIARHGEHDFLNFLDGEIQKENAIFVATTNYIGKVPSRILRPGRFSVLLEVGLPSYEARLHYLMSKIDKDSALKVAKNTEEFTIDMLKEVVRLFYCLKKPLDEALARVKGRISNNKDIGSPSEDEEVEDWEEDNNWGN